MPRIDAQAHRDLDGLVELGEAGFLDDLERLTCLVRARDVTVLRRRCVLLSMRAHQSTTSTPMERAAPAIIAIADSSESQLRSGSLSSAILRICARVTRPTLLRFGWPEPFSIPASFLRSTAAGGVFVMKVKDLSEK